MITVTFEKEEGALRKVTVSGHSGYGEAGEDIVCAGITILTISILNGLSEIAGIDVLDREVEEGYTSFKLPKINNPVQKIQMDTLMETFHLGVAATASAYGDYVTIIDK